MMFKISQQTASSPFCKQRFAKTRSKIVIMLICLVALFSSKLFAANANTIIQAHQYTAKSGVVNIKTGIAPDANSIGQIAAGDWVSYKDIDFGAGGHLSFMAYLSVATGSLGKNIEIRIDSPTGNLIGTLKTDFDGDVSIFKEQYATVTNVVGVHDVYLVFPSNEVANIDWFVFSKYKGSETKPERDIRMKWWLDARFGRFIHWGGYSQLAGEYPVGSGTAAPIPSEWIMKNSNISKAEYENIATKPLNPTSFNAATWVKSCKDAGQKYMVFTSKHHEGFAMFDNEVTGFNSITDPTKLYDIMHFGNYGKDPMLALSQECKIQGVKFCAYYSIFDWYHVSQTRLGSNSATEMQPGMKDIYVSQMKEQLQEIIAKYDVELLWFDGEWSAWWTTADGASLYKYLRTIKPSLIINNRVGKRGQADGDYGTPEDVIPENGLPYDWESCMTMNSTWGYSKFRDNDNSYGTAVSQVRQLIDIVSKGGNLLLNVGPTGLGVVPARSENILLEVGNWLKINGASIYGATRSDFQNVKFGKVTKKDLDYYLHVWTVAADKTITLPMLADPTVTPEAFLLKDLTPVPVQVTANGLILNLAGVTLDPSATVIVLKAKGEVMQVYSDPNANGSFVLTGANVEIAGSTLRVETTGNLGYWTSAADYALWNINVPKTGKYKAVVRYAVDNAYGGRNIKVQSAISNSSVIFTSATTGGWQIYKDFALDSIQLNAGKQQLKIGANDGKAPYINLMSITLTSSLASLTDSDGDGVFDVQDNCPNTANPLQQDLDGDGIGDICDASPDDKLLTITPPTNGMVDVNPAGISQIKNATVTLTAKPAIGYKFNGWSGNLTGSNIVTTLKMDAHKTVSASFVKTNNFAVNYGAGQYITADGTVYAQTPAGYTTANAITGTDDQLLYNSEMFGKTFSLDYPVTNGDYTVTLKFAELFHTAAGRRVFNVAIEGTPILTNFDVFVDAGGNNKALDKTYQVTVADGVLNIGFTTITDNAKINAVKVSNNTETSLDAISLNNNITIFPNPATDKLFFNSADKLISKIELVDLTGKIVYAANVQLHKGSIDLKGIAKCVYLVKIQADNSIITKKISVK